MTCMDVVPVIIKYIWNRVCSDTELISNFDGPITAPIE